MDKRFSDRIGVTRPRHEIQLDSMDIELRNGLWNWVCWALDNNNYHSRHNYWHAIAHETWDDFFNDRRDAAPTYSDVPDALRTRFFEFQWFEVYNFVQYLLPRVNRVRESYDKRDNLVDMLNYYLERGLSGYRCVGELLVPVTSPPELAAIRNAGTPRTGFEGVAEHISTALAMLAKKPEPDYRNSIKESMSAVEAAIRLLTGVKSGGIDAALSRLDKKHPLHPVFKVALSKLYAYTSDEDGIRHPILDTTTDITAADAKFMLVVCSAFANYVIDAGR
jgi:AbiJ N-terminal domain 4